MSKQASPLQSVTVYGVSHSPWVQGILYALAHHKIPTRLTSYPISPRWFWHRGVVFPVLRLDDGTTHVDSFHMYELLESKGYSLGVSHISVADRQKAQFELEKLFSNYSLGRAIPGKRWQFMVAWSTMKESPDTFHGIICRVFLCYYFWLLIQVVVFLTKRRKRAFFVLEETERQLAEWDERLSDSAWLTGDEVGFLDFALFGQLQCMTTGLTDELLPIIQRQPNLMRWIQDMHTVIHDNGTPVFTKRLFDREVQLPEPRRWQRVIFWLAWSGYLLCFPLTLLLVALSFRNRFKNPAHSGAVLEKYRHR